MSSETQQNQAEKEQQADKFSELTHGRETFKLQPARVESPCWLPRVFKRPKKGYTLGAGILSQEKRLTQT